MLRWVRVFGACVMMFGLVLGLSSTTPVSSDAGNRKCDKGEFCLWGEDNYQGCFYDSEVSNFWLNNTPWRNCPQARVDQGANSIRNRGVFCDVKLWDWPGGAGGWKIMNRPAAGGWTEDRDLANNFWIGGGGSLENDISAYKFCP